MVPVEDVVQLALKQAGDRYRFGTETRYDDPDPDEFDCSELVEWTCTRLKVQPKVPDGSWYQARHAQTYSKLVAVDKGIRTRGALLFRFSSSPFVGSRPTSSHVAISLGDGRTIEARSTVLGVGVFAGAEQRAWTHAGLIPGVEYGVASGPDVPVVGVQVRPPVLRLTVPYTTGGWVRKLQGLLMAHGTVPANSVAVNGALDGVFGPGTENAVRRFQVGRELSVVNGVADEATWSHLLNG